MFDLNLSINFRGEDKFPANSDGACSTRASDFSDCATTSYVGNDEDDTDHGPGLVTRELFPVSRLGEFNRGQNGAAEQPRMAVQQELQQVQARKSRRGPRSRSSQYRGVTFYRRTGRWESHIWDSGKQVYLGGFDTALAAARVYDKAAIRFRGVDADINFNLSDYDDLKEMQKMNLSKEEFVHLLRRQSTGFSRGSSKYRGVTLHKCGRWEARMGQFLGKKAYDKAAVMCNGGDAFTNFELSKYNGETISSSCNNEGSQHDLNLNLGMSASPSESGFSGTLKLRVGNSTMDSIGNPPLEGVPVTSEHPILCSGVNPKFVPNYEEKTIEQRTESVSPHELANWAGQMHGHFRANPDATSATAASSGFSSQITNSPIDCASLAPIGFSLCPNISANASGCHSWI